MCHKRPFLVSRKGNLHRECPACVHLAVHSTGPSMLGMLSRQPAEGVWEQDAAVVGAVAAVAEDEAEVVACLGMDCCDAEVV